MDGVIKTIWISAIIGTLIGLLFIPSLRRNQIVEQSNLDYMLSESNYEQDNIEVGH